MTISISKCKVFLTRIKLTCLLSSMEKWGLVSYTCSPFNTPHGHLHVGGLKQYNSICLEIPL